MTVHLLISGFVQRVGYRQFVKKEAIKLGLTGWVKNLSDRRVEVEVVGEKETLQELIKRCKKGSFLANVKEIKEDWFEKDDNYDKFVVLLE